MAALLVGIVMTHFRIGVSSRLVPEYDFLYRLRIP